MVRPFLWSLSNSGRVTGFPGHRLRVGRCVQNNGRWGDGNCWESGYSVEDLVQLMFHCGDCSLEAWYSIVFHYGEKGINRWWTTGVWGGSVGLGALGVSRAQCRGGELNYGAGQNPRSALLGDLFLMSGWLQIVHDCQRAEWSLAGDPK